jgi:DNA-binding NarL/FixJ family response regulator
MKHGRVLLADSHLGMLQGVHSLLDALFETVLMVADERSLIDAVATFNPELVVLDLSLPGGEEVNIAKRLKEKYESLRLIVLSVHDEPAVAASVREAGAAGFVLKRYAGKELVPAVKKVLQGGVFVSAAVKAD